MDKIDLVLQEYNLYEKSSSSDEYDEMFKRIMKEWGIESPEELSKKDREKFFKQIEKEWRKK